LTYFEKKPGWRKGLLPTPCRSGAGVVDLGGLPREGLDPRSGFEVAAVVNLLDDGKTWELDEVDVAEGELEEDSADGSTVHDADLLPCGIDHDSGKTRLARKHFGIPKES